MSNQYDVIMIGAGPSAIFCAYELKRNKPDMKVLMIEKGRRIEKRACPKRNTKVCVGCKPCSITTGFAGAGAFSDGKLSLSPDVGGNLPEILGYDRTIELLKESDDIYLKFGADEKVYGIDEEEEIASIRKKAIQANLKLIECPIRHLGTEEGYKIYSRLQEHLLNEGVDMIFDTMVKDIIIEDGVAKGVVTDKGETYTADEIVAAVGREGSEWLSGICRKYDIETQEELAKKLEESGFAVTQATISRDIRQLKLTKVPKENGGSRYAVLQNAPSEVGSRYARVLKDAYISVDLAKNILVIKTVSGMAMAAAAAFDEMNWNEIVGCIGGDDTTLCVARDDDAALVAAERLKKMVDGMEETGEEF